jgi:hypothetical protein
LNKKADGLSPKAFGASESLGKFNLVRPDEQKGLMTFFPTLSGSIFSSAWLNVVAGILR